MRDAVELEWAGIPAVCIVHRTLAESAAAIARISGHPDYPMIIVDYPYTPTAMWDDDAMHVLAKELAPQVRARLTRMPEPDGEPGGR